MLSGKNKKMAYWICQLLGWGSWVLEQFLQLGDMKLSIAIDYTWDFFFMAAFGIFITHIYRLSLRNVPVLKLPLYKQLPLLFFFLVLLSTLMYASAVIPAFISGRITAISIQDLSFVQYIEWFPVIAVWMLCYHAYKLSERKIEEERAKTKALEERKNFEMEVLRSQLNPHFLFNALNSIRSLINSNPARAREASTLLSALLRYTLRYDQRMLIPIHEEMEMVKYYLQLEKIRFDERLQYHIHADAQAGNVLVPPLLLLTITENAVKHGISQHEDGGNITFNIYRKNNFITVHVTNTGQILNPDEPSNGIGMDNSEKRLQALYAGKAKLLLYNADSNTVVTEVHVPALYSEDEVMQHANKIMQYA